ncbi:MAG: 1-phosphofructokinase family hexose kinase [Ardenticatenaceae bacterium]
MNKIVTLTVNPSVDKNSSIPYVVAEHKLRCQRPTFEPGGGGLNVSRAIKRLGGQSFALYVAGGPTGEILKQLLDQEKLNHRAMPLAGWTRQNLTVFEEATTQQYRFIMPGPTLDKTEWQRCLDELAALCPKPDYIVASGSLPLGVPTDFYARVARLAKQLEIRLILDTSGEPLRQAAQEGVYLLKPNMRELGQLAGRQIEQQGEMEEIARTLVESGPNEAIVVSLGAAGAFFILETEAKTSKTSETEAETEAKTEAKAQIGRVASPTVPIRSKVGAGDSMVAGIVLSLARGLSLQHAICFGVSAGAAAVMTPGTALCRRQDAEQLFERIISEGITTSH